MASPITPVVMSAAARWWQTLGIQLLLQDVTLFPALFNFVLKMGVARFFFSKYSSHGEDEGRAAPAA